MKPTSSLSTLTENKMNIQWKTQKETSEANNAEKKYLQLLPLPSAEAGLETWRGVKEWTAEVFLLGFVCFRRLFLRLPLDVHLVLYECGQGGGWLHTRPLSPVQDLLGLPLPAQ